MSEKTILVIGTYDTKDDELGFLSGVIRDQGGRVVTMDVSVLGNPSQPTDYSKHDVAEEGGSSIQDAIDSGDENLAMQIMAKGASLLATRLYNEGKFDGMITLRPTWEWDVAAGVLMVEEAGGVVCDRMGNAVQFNNPTPQSKGLIATTHRLHDQFLEKLDLR